MNFTKKPIQSIIDSLHYEEWIIDDFKIIFLLSERVLIEIKKLSQADNWYEDPILSATYIDRAHTCFISIQKYHKVFGILPQVGDRLYNEDTGMIIQERAIDGGLMTITFTLSV